MSSSKEAYRSGPILAVFVVGFHHKKGCLIEYCFPSLNHFFNEFDKFENSDQTGINLPLVWKTLPSLALPDGSHNYNSDTIYFHLPHPLNPSSTVFGVSCYRQISSELLTHRSSDVTRGTVQKSVVIISELPLYGFIADKCEMITFAYFNECDFSKVNCLQELYFNLNQDLATDYLNSNEFFMSLSPQKLISIFSHKVLILFKLILLEKRVLFFKSPTKSLCTTILTLLSLFPGMIESGGLIHSSTSVIPKLNSMRKFSGDIELINPNHFFFKINKQMNISLNTSEPVMTESKDFGDITDKVNKKFENHRHLFLTLDQFAQPDEAQSTEDINSLHKKNKKKEERQKDFNEDDNSANFTLLKLTPASCGLPLKIFTNGSFCHPYLSLTYLDILNDPNVRSFVIGATNILFKQKKCLFDVIVEVDGAKIEINDPDLEKSLNLSTEDLRFADYLVKGSSETLNFSQTNYSNQFESIDSKKCDQWLRYNFKIYLLHLLRTSECEENRKEYSCFNTFFINSWKETHNYKLWSSQPKSGIFEVNPGHPFTGQLSMSDMKLKLSQVVFNTERGKKLNQTVSQTSKAVGGALTSARSWIYSQFFNSDKKPPDSFSSFSFSNLLKSSNLNNDLYQVEKNSKNITDI